MYKHFISLDAHTPKAEFQSVQCFSKMAEQFQIFKGVSEIKILVVFLTDKN